MRGLRGAAFTATTFALLAGAMTAPSVAVAAPAKAVTTGVTADYEMNEVDGSTVMTDSSGNGLDGVIDQAGLDTGFSVAGETGYDWTARAADTPPPVPERVITVLDDPGIEPGSEDFTVEVKFRTTQSFGTIAQKGQSSTAGGQWKVQIPGGIPSCNFTGAAGQVATSAGAAFNDGQWHVLRCVLTQTELSLYVDNVFKRKKTGTTGTINNAVDLTVGGKLTCNETTVSCDYYSGQLGYLKITEGAAATSQPPTAKFTSSCDLLDCSFNSSTSTDTDGTIASYAWTFGDGDTSTTANPSHHMYSIPGDYQVKLIVTDNDGLTDSATHTISVLSGIPPSRPRQVTAKAGDGRVTVAWKKSSIPGDSPVSGYVATATPGGATCSTTTELTCAVTGLTNGVAYTFRVSAHNDQGTGAASKATAPVTPAGKPKAPGTVTAKAGDHQVTVHWTAANPSGAPITAYRIRQLPGGKTTRVGGGARTAVITGLTNGHKYQFSVAAVNRLGIGAATTGPKVTPAGAPLRVGHVSAAARVKAALVSWRAARANGSAVLRYTVSASNGKHRTVNASERSVLFDKLRRGTDYRFRVRAINAVGAGPWSKWSPAVTPH